jgi:hypothetical protein
MKLETIKQDIEKLEKALQIIEKTENYLHFKKSHLIFEICEQINVLKEKKDRQVKFLNTIAQ